MASSRKWPRLVISYLVAYFLFYSLSSIVFTIYVNNFSGDQTGAGIGLASALPLMFLLASIFYFFVPGSTLVAIYLPSGWKQPRWFNCLGDLDQTASREN